MLRNIGVRPLFERQKHSKIDYVVNTVLVLLALVLFSEIIFYLNFTVIKVDGESMMPTLMDGDYIFIETKISPDYGDIVVVKNKDYYIIKRVVACGGDTVRIVAGVLQVKYKGAEEFSTIEENYLCSEFNTPGESVNNFSECYVEEGKLFLLGDNRNISKDSRYYNAFPVENVVGVVPQWALNIKEQLTAFYSNIKIIPSTTTN